MARPLSTVQALERLDRELGPHASELRLARIPATPQHDIERLAAVVAPNALTDELVTLLARGGLTPWDSWPGTESMIDHPLATGYPQDVTPWLILGQQDPDIFQIVLPSSPSESSPVVVFSTNALFFCAIFLSLRTYFTGFCEAFRLWQKSPAASDPDDGPTTLTGSWWEVVGTDDPYEPIDGLREVLDGLIREEDPTWPSSPMGFIEPGEEVPPEWAARLRLQTQ